MSGAAGFLYSLTVNGVESSWKNIDWNDDNAGVDSTSRMAPDGSTNEGFADRDYDISTFSMTLTEMSHGSDDDRGDITENVFSAQAGDRNPDDAWILKYDGVQLYHGTGIYYSSVNGSGAIPGEGRIGTRLQAIGPYEKDTP